MEKRNGKEFARKRLEVFPERVAPKRASKPGKAELPVQGDTNPSRESASDTDTEALKLEEQAKVFKEVPRELDESTASEVGSIVTLIAIYAVCLWNPLSVIPHSPWGDSIEIVAIIVAFTFLFVLGACYLLIDLAADKFKAGRKRYYGELAGRAESGDVFEGGRVAKPFRKPKSQGELVLREKTILVLLVIIMALVIVGASYLGLGALLSVFYA